MRKLMTAPAALAVFVALAASPAVAAEPWGIEHEKQVQITGTVVDLVCTLKGGRAPADCPAACGAGKRQLGLLGADGSLRAAVKSAADFAGATVDLAPYCGRTIEVDGLLIENPAITLLMVQGIRTKPSETFVPADGFNADWAARNGKADEWFRADPRVRGAIEADGVYGIKGLEPKK